MRQAHIAIIITALLVLLSTPAIVHASLFGSDNASPAQQQNPFPIQDEEGFKANTRPFHQIPFNNPKYEFDILLPKDWTSEPIVNAVGPSTRQSIPEDIARFKSPMLGVSQAVITIQAMHLDHEISAENWLKNYAITNNFTLQDKVSAAGDKKASMSYISIYELKSTYVYMAAQVNADTIILTRFEIPLALRDPIKFLQKRAIDSFRLILVNDDPVEKQKEYALSDALHFAYPESWTVRYPDFNDVNNVSVQIHNEAPGARQVDGLIRFVAVRRSAQTSLTLEMKKIRKYFDEFLGLDIQKMASSDKAPVASRFLFSRLETYEVEAKKKNVVGQELQLIVLGDKEWYIIAFLLTPRENDNLSAWARNIQTFNQILKSMK